MSECDSISFVSTFFSTASLVSWICAQLPQIYTNYRTKSAEGVSPHFLLLWFMGDFLSFTSCLLNDVVLPFQVYLSLFFMCNDVTLCYQYYYYNSVYPKLHGAAEQPSTRTHANTSTLVPNTDQPAYLDTATHDAEISAYTSDSIQIHRSKQPDKGSSPIAEYLSSLGSPPTYNSFDDSTANTPSTSATTSTTTGSGSHVNSKPVSATVALGAAAMNLSLANALPLFSRDVASVTSSSASQRLGTILAWACTVVYVSSRCPQLYKNYKRKSVDGISPLLFGSALAGNLTYTLSILTSCKFLFANDKSTFIMRELPYILGSSGTIVFDIAYFYQRYIYRFSGRNTLVMEMEDENWEES